MKHKPYQKPQNTLQFIHKEFNHPPDIIKQISITIKTRLLNHSSNEGFPSYYEKTLKKSRYNVYPQYKPTNQNANNKVNRKRNIIWFNLSFSKTVSTKNWSLFLLIF